MNKDRRHTIWSNIDLDFDEWRDDLKADYPNLDDDALYSLMVETNMYYLDDERINLNIQLGDSIIVIADLGLWNGRCSGYKEIESGNIADCLYTECGYATWYVDKNGDLRSVGIHHDGTNYYLYRVWKTEVSETARDNLRAKLYDGTATRADITRVTRRLGDYIAEVYGWTDIAPRKKKCEVA